MPKIIFFYLLRYLYIKNIVMKNLKITEEAHNLLKNYCDKNYLKISEWVSNEIIRLIKEKENGKTK